MTNGFGEGQSNQGLSSSDRLLARNRLFSSLLARLDRVGCVFGVMATAALLFQPFVTYRTNRIASGKSVTFVAALPQTAGCLGGAILCVAIFVAFSRTPIAWRAIAAFSALLALIGLIGLVPSHLVAPNSTFARVSPSSGFWILTLAFALLAADTLAKLKPGPWVRLLALAGVVVAMGLILGSGWLDGMSVLKEYASHANTFWREVTKHIELALGSLGGAVIVGVPLGIACARSPRLRGITLPVLNVIQTIPSIAMYGLMMVPLGLLATQLPFLSDLGIRGIGTAPAVIALFLYSLLPVVANTVIGLDQVPPQTSEAARGMGMSGRQRLLQVELPLATPIILTGIRIVLVQNIGLVTVAALIGGGGLGTFVFQGIGQSATDLVLLGTVPIIALAFAAAVLLDAAIDLTRGAVP